MLLLPKAVFSPTSTRVSFNTLFSHRISTDHVLRPTAKEDDQGWQRSITGVVVRFTTLACGPMVFFLLYAIMGFGKPRCMALRSRDVHYVHGSDMILDS